MATAARTPPRMAAEEFLEWLDGQPEGARYELIDGRIVSLDDPTTGLVNETARHTDAKGEIFGQLRQQLPLGSSCRARVDGVAVRFDNGDIVFPDVMGDCSGASGDDRFIDRPVLIVEVLSPSTHAHDFLVKSRRYLRIPGLVVVILVDLDAPNAVVLRPETPEEPEVTPPDATVRFELSSGSVALDLKDVFAAAGVSIERV